MIYRDLTRGIRYKDFVSY